MSAAKDLLLAALATDDLSAVSIPALPALDGKIFVRVLNAGERHLYGSVALDAKEQGQIISDYEVVAICACEQDGTPMFHTRDDAGRITISSEEVDRLRAVDGRAIYAIAAKAMEVSGLMPGAREAAKKNSLIGPSGESSIA